MLNCDPRNNKQNKKMSCYNEADWTSLHVKLASVTDKYFKINEANSRSVQENWKYLHKNLTQATN